MIDKDFEILKNKVDEKFANTIKLLKIETCRVEESIAWLEFFDPKSVQYQPELLGLSTKFFKRLLMFIWADIVIALCNFGANKGKTISLHMAQQQLRNNGYCDFAKKLEKFEFAARKDLSDLRALRDKYYAHLDSDFENHIANIQFDKLRAKEAVAAVQGYCNAVYGEFFDSELGQRDQSSTELAMHVLLSQLKKAKFYDDLDRELQSKHEFTKHDALREFSAEKFLNLE